MIKKILISIVGLVLLWACNASQNPSNDNTKDSLLENDIQFRDSIISAIDSITNIPADSIKNLSTEELIELANKSQLGRFNKEFPLSFCCMYAAPLNNC